MRLATLSLGFGGAAGGVLWSDVCTQPATKALPFCDVGRPLEERVADFAGRVPIVAKPGLMQSSAVPFEPLHIPAYQWGGDGLHGPWEPCVCASSAAPTRCKCPTSFPAPSAMASAFNLSLYARVGEVVGTQARAINNMRNHATQNAYGDGIDYWDPTINLQRDPRWGRNQEAPGEDPTLAAGYASALSPADLEISSDLGTAVHAGTYELVVRDGTSELRREIEVL